MREGEPSKPVFSVVVPMRNEEASVEETLNSLLHQEYPAAKYEILVVDGRSTDGSRAVVSRLSQRHANVALLENPRQSSAAGRNVGVLAARGEFIAIVDCHSFISPDFLAQGERAFRVTGADCLGRRVEFFLPGDSYLQRAIGLARTSWLGHDLQSRAFTETDNSGAPTRVSPLSHGALYRRSVFKAVGLFDEAYDACEDVEFNARVEAAGLKSWSVDSLVCYYHPRPTLAGLFRQMSRYAIGRCRLRRRHSAGFRVSHILPLASLAAFLALLASAFAGWLPWVVPSAAVAAYLVLVCCASVLAACRRGASYLPALPVVFAVIHLGVASGLAAAAIRDIRWAAGDLARILWRAREGGTANSGR